jgi:hypothetical protein
MFWAWGEFVRKSPFSFFAWPVANDRYVVREVTGFRGFFIWGIGK